MPYQPIDITKLEQIGAQVSTGGYTPIDVNKIQLDTETKPSSSQYDTSPSRTILERGMEGATFGVGNRAMDALGAGIASVATGQNPINLYNQAREMSRQQSEAQQQERPVLTLASQIGGGLVTGLAGSGTRAGAAISGWAGRGLFPQAQSLAGRAANLFTKMGKGAGVGAATGAAFGAGSTTGDMGEAAKSGALYGAAGGAAVPVIGAAVSGAASALTPKLAEGMQGVAELAQKYDIPVSIPQISQNKPVQTLQKVSQEIPFSGVEAFREKQLEAFNRSLLKTVGVNATKVTPEIMDEAFTRVGKQFDSLGKGKIFKIEQSFKDQVSEILKDAEITAKKDAIDNFNKGLQRIYDNVAPDGTISGERLSFLRQELNKLSRKASDPDTQELLKDLEGSVIDVMTAGDDVAKGVLSDAKQKYKNLIVIEPIAQKAVGGNISPSLLANRVAKVYGRQYTRGKAGDVGDIARIGKELLPELGGSDTAQKLIQAGAVGGAITGLATAPAATIGAAASVAPVIVANRATQKLILQNQKLVDKIINKGKQGAGNAKALPKEKIPPTLPTAPMNAGKVVEYVTLPDGTTVPRITVNPIKNP